MRLCGLAVLWAGAGALAGSFACSSDAQQAGGSAAGAAGMSGASSDNGGGGGAGNPSSAGNPGSAGSAGLSACPEQPVPQRTQGTLLSLPLKLVLANQPFVFGEPNALPDGGSLVPLNFRFYVSQVELLPASGEAPVAVDVVTAAGVPAPYGVHLFNAEEPDSSTLRVLAPPGQYSGLSFALGVKLACNQQPPSRLSDPLSDTSQMTWPHTGGFLFLRYEARYTDASGSAGASSALGIPSMVHMGGDTREERVPRATIPAALSIPASGTLEKGIRVAVDEIFKGATAEIDVSDVAVGFLSSPESIAGERLRRQLPELHVFVPEP